MLDYRLIELRVLRFMLVGEEYAVWNNESLWQGFLSLRLRIESLNPQEPDSDHCFYAIASVKLFAPRLCTTSCKCELFVTEPKTIRLNLMAIGKVSWKKTM